jgi:hypothetical protein
MGRIFTSKSRANPLRPLGQARDSIRRLVARLTGSTEKPVRRMEVEAGAEAQVDFGKGASLIGADGKRKTSWVLRWPVLSLPRSPTA